VTATRDASSAHPLASFGLDMLARGAARLRADRPAFAEAGHGPADQVALTWRELDRRAIAFGARVSECGLSPGDRVVVAGAPRVSTLIAVLGAIGAGFEPVIAPVQTSADALAFLAQSTGAAAIVGLSSFAGLDIASSIFDAAAAAHVVRLVGSLGPDVPDGATDFSLQSLAGDDEPARIAGPKTPPRLGFVLAPDQRTPLVTFVTQSDLIAQALDLVALIGATAERPIVSTLSPASVAGFLAGPAVALLAGAPLVLFAPFDGHAFMDLVDRRSPCHLVAPALIADDLSREGVADRLDSLTLAAPVGASLSLAAQLSCPVVRLDTDERGGVSASQIVATAATASHSRFR